VMIITSTRRFRLQLSHPKIRSNTAQTVPQHSPNSPPSALKGGSLGNVGVQFGHLRSIGSLPWKDQKMHRNEERKKQKKDAKATMRNACGGVFDAGALLGLSCLVVGAVLFIVFWRGALLCMVAFASFCFFLSSLAIPKSTPRHVHRHTLRVPKTPRNIHPRTQQRPAKRPSRHAHAVQSPPAGRSAPSAGGVAFGSFPLVTAISKTIIF
jgi:hypothetical protein